MIAALARLVANAAGLVWETAGEAVRRYVSVAVKASLAGIGAGVLGLLFLVGGTSAGSNVIAALGILLIACAPLAIGIATLPISIPLELAGNRWPIIRRRLDGTCLLLMQAFLLAFYVIVHDATRYPALLYYLAGCYVLLGVSYLLPSDAWPIAFVRNRLGTYLVIGAASILGIAQVLPDSAVESVKRKLGAAIGIAFDTNPDEISFTINARDQLIDGATGGPLILFAPVASADSGGQLQPVPLVGAFQDPVSRRYRLYKWVAGQQSVNSDGDLIRPLVRADVAAIKAQARRDLAVRPTQHSRENAPSAMPTPPPAEEPTRDGRDSTTQYHETPSVLQRDHADFATPIAAPTAPPALPAPLPPADDEGRRRAEEIQLVETLARQPSRANSPVRDGPLVMKQTVVLRWSGASTDLASAFVARLRALGASVILDPSGARQRLATYPSAEFAHDLRPVAEAIRAGCIDLARLELNSGADGNRVVVVLP